MGGFTSNVLGKLKEERQLVFKSGSEQLIERTSESISHEQRGNDQSECTVPVYDEQICQLETPQVTTDHATLSMSNSLAQDRRTVTPAGFRAEMLMIEQGADPRELPAKLTVTCSKDNFESSEDNAGKKSVAVQPGSFFDWKVCGKFEHDRINKG